MISTPACVNCGAVPSRPVTRCLKCGLEVRQSNPVVQDSSGSWPAPTPEPTPVPPPSPMSTPTTFDTVISTDERVLFSRVRSLCEEFISAVAAGRGESERRLHNEIEAIDRETEDAITAITATMKSGLSESLNRAASEIAAMRKAQQVLRAESDSRTEVIRIGTLAFAANVDEKDRVACFVPLQNRGHLVIRVGKVEDAREVVQNALVQTLTHTEAGQVLFDIIDPSLTSICSPFARLKDVNTALAPTIATTSSEIAAMLSRLQTTVSNNAQLLQGKWDSLGGFLDSSNGEEKIPNRVLVILGWPSRDSGAIEQTLEVLLRRGAQNGVAAIIVDDGWVGRCKNPVLSDNSEIIDLRGGTRWMRFPGLTLTLDRGPAVEHIRTLCENVAREALVVGVPLVDIMSVLGDYTPIWAKSSSERIDITIGRSGSEKVSFTLGDARENTHNILIGGTVGTGKSNLLLTMIYSIAVQYSPDEVEMYLLDFKEGVEFARFAKDNSYLPHARVVGIQADAQLGQGVLRGLVRELEERSKSFLSVGATSVREFREKSGQRMSRVLLVVDEFQELFNDETVATSSAELLETLVRRGRSFGIHVVLASQTLSGIKGMMTNRSAIFDQFRIRIALRLNRDESTVVLGHLNFAASELRARGEAILNTESGLLQGNRQVVVAHASEPSLEAITGHLHERSTGQRPMVVQREALATHEQYQVALTSKSSRNSAVVGMPLVVGGNACEVAQLGRTGRHIMMTGDGDAEGAGIIHSITDSLSRTMRSDLQILVVGALHGSAEEILARPHWLRSLSAQGAEVEELDSVSQVVEAVGRRRGVLTLVLALGADDLTSGSAPSLLRPSDEGISNLRGVISEGHLHGVSLFGWWQNIGGLSMQLGHDWDKQVLMRIALRADAQTIRQTMSSIWHGDVPRRGRALFRDISTMSEPELIIPFEPFGRVWGLA